MTIFGKILAILNVLAAAAFAFLALKDHSVRQKWAKAVYDHDRAIHGQPLQDQYVDPSLPRERYLAEKASSPDSESLKNQFTSTGASGAPVNTQKKELEILKDPRQANSFFAAVNQAAKELVKAKKISLKDVLEPLAVNGQQLARFQKRIARARAKGKEDALLEEAAKRRMLREALLPLEELRPGSRREQVAALIADLDRPYAQLEKLLISRIDDLLQPAAEDAADKDSKDKKKSDDSGLILELISVKKLKQPPKGDPHQGMFLQSNAQYRLRYKRNAKEGKVTVWLLQVEQKQGAKEDEPPTYKESTTDASPVRLTVDNLEGQPRIDLSRQGSAYTAREDVLATDQVLSGTIAVTLAGKEEDCHFIEREPLTLRKAVAYLLFTFSQVQRPDGKPVLATLTDKRLEAIVGRTWFNRAVEMQTVVFRQIAERRMQEIEYDLESFAGKYNREIKVRLPYLIALIKQQQADLDDWKEQKKKRDDQLEARQTYHKEILTQLKKERALATEALAELALWQQRLFEAQKKGAGVAEENQRLEREIRRLERGR